MAGIALAPKMAAKVENSCTFKPRINCTSLMKNAINDSRRATPAATAVNRVSFALMVRSKRIRSPRSLNS